MGGLDGCELARKRSVGFEVVHVHLGLLTIDDVGQDGLLELVVVGVRVVKVERAFHRLGRLSWSEISVERVLAQDLNLFLLCVHLGQEEQFK